MTENQEPNETGYGRIIREAKEEAFHARRQLRRELPTPSQQTKKDVAAALADYHDVLHDYSDERALKTDWEERVPINPDALLGTTVSVEKAFSSRNQNATETVEAPAVATVSARELLDLGKVLDEIAKELGFAASAKQPTPEEEATMEDLRGLLKARGQTQALEHLPGDVDDVTVEEYEEAEKVADGGEDE